MHLSVALPPRRPSTEALKFWPVQSRSFPDPVRLQEMDSARQDLGQVVPGQVAGVLPTREAHRQGSRVLGPRAGTGAGVRAGAQARESPKGKRPRREALEWRGRHPDIPAWPALEPPPRRPRRAPRTWPRGARLRARRGRRDAEECTGPDHQKSGPRRSARRAAYKAGPAARGLVRRPRPIAGRRPI